jgi:dCMP deaminase
MKTKDIEFLLNVAKLAATRSTAERLKVGGIIVDSFDNIVAYGYNGTVNGASNICEYKEYADTLSTRHTDYPHFDLSAGKYYKLVTKESTVHCEANLISHAARRGISVNNGTVLLTHSSCIHCTPMLIQSGIKEVIFLEKFRTYDEVFLEFGKNIIFTQWK